MKETVYLLTVVLGIFAVGALGGYRYAQIRLASAVMEATVDASEITLLGGSGFDTEDVLERLATVESMYQAWRADYKGWLEDYNALLEIGITYNQNVILVPGSLMTPDGEELPIHFRAWYGKVEMPDGSGRGR